MKTNQSKNPLIVYLFFILFLFILAPFPCLGQTVVDSPDQVWSVGTNRWTAEEEQRFANWVEENITEDFFIRYRTPTDCADLAYAVRWIYSRVAHLPAAATTKDGRLFGHWSKDWKRLPTDPDWRQDQRFRASLLFLLAETSTRTLPIDTYPVRISPDSVTAGTVLLMSSNHCGIVGHVSPGGGQPHPLLTWESMLPIKVRKLVLRSFFAVKPESKIHTGLLKFRWPVLEEGAWKQLTAREHPFYSEEQYNPGFYKGCPDYVEAVARRIEPADFEPAEKAVKLMATITRFLKDRVSVVLAGYERCSGGGCREETELWETYSTLGNDGMIVLMMDHLSRIVEAHHIDKKWVERKMQAISIDISKNRRATFYDIYENCRWLSPHPYDSVEARWGMNKCGMILVQIQNARDSVAFIKKTYGKRDPNYAAFSIRQQEDIIRRLNEDLAKSSCYLAAAVN
jgi:hypothetical protein